MVGFSIDNGHGLLYNLGEVIMKGTLNTKRQIFAVSPTAFGQSFTDLQLKGGFVAMLKLQGNTKEVGRTLLCSRPFLRIELCNKSVVDNDSFTPCQKADHIERFQVGGTVCVLEATMTFDSPMFGTKEMTVDVPVCLLDPSRPVYLRFDGVRLAWIQNEIINCDFPYGEVVDFVDGPYQNGAGVAFDMADALTESEVEQPAVVNMAYFCPTAYNEWAGDTSVFSKDGVYHLTYLVDRHHHTARWGAGGHEVKHLITRDFVNWTDVGTLVKVDEPWKSVGTGTMFYWNGKYGYTHGWHTERVVPEEQTGNQIFIERGHEQVNTPITYEEIASRGFLPAGTAFMQSDDGINFSYVNMQLHVAENPSVYPASDGGLTMMAGFGSRGEWHADAPTKTWTKVDQFDVTKGVMKASEECPFLFEKGNFKYLVAGTNGFWMRKGCEPWQEVAADGTDVYDGTFVPSVCVGDDGRIILSGWVSAPEWGYFIVHRELTQRPDGRLDMKWLKELAPKAEELVPCEGKDLIQGRSYYYRAKVKVGKSGKVKILLDGDTQTEILLDTKAEKMQIAKVADGTAPSIATMAEQMPNLDSRDGLVNPHFKSQDFALGRVDVIKGEYDVKMVVYYEPKMGNTIVDMEVAGARTLISNRGKVSVRSIITSVQDGLLVKEDLHEII